MVFSCHVIAGFPDGRCLNGFVFDFLPTREKCWVFPSATPYTGEAQEVGVPQLKHIFFVKEFSGLQALDSAKFTAVAHGRRIEVIFKDGERLIGTTEGYSPHRLGFFVLPANSRGNILRVFVVNANVRQVKRVPEGQEKRERVGLPAIGQQSNDEAHGHGCRSRSRRPG